MTLHLVSEGQVPSHHGAGTPFHISVAKIRETLQHRLLHDLVQGESLVAIMETLCRTVQQMIPGVHMAVARIDSAGRSRTLTGPDRVEAGPTAIETTRAVPGGSRWPEWSAERAMAPGPRGDRRWPEHHDLVAGLDYTSVRSSAIRDRLGVVKGAVTFYSRAALTPTVFQWHILETCTDLCALVFERADAQERIHFLAHRDPLTGLFNRGYFKERVGDAMRRADGAGHLLALHLIDLDRFKEVNDRRGHLAGDRLLVEIARQLEREAGPADIVGRLGGDEFVFLQVDVGSPEDALRRGQQLARAIETAVTKHDPRIGSGASIGCAIYPRDATRPRDLLRNADLALYKAKEGGGGRACRYDVGMTTELDRRRGLEDGLRAALAGAGGLQLAYQPQFALADGRLVGFEALARWQHPRLGAIAPEVFIPIAEDSGLILELGAWVLRAACTAAASWPADTTVAVNLSAIQLVDGHLPALVHAVLSETGLDPRRLELEITEQVLIDDKDTALQVLRRLSALGVAIVMDDFGTGYSSLSHLQIFPFDKIKIDRSFVSSLESSAASRARVDAVVGLCEAIGVPVTAEGVETQVQYDILRSKKCAFALGHLLGAAMPEEMLFAQPGGSRPGPGTKTVTAGGAC